MSNYPNMSYCMFENTYAAMIQILDAMREAEAKGELAEFHDGLSREERQALHQLAYACEDYQDMMDALEDPQVEEEE